MSLTLPTLKSIRRLLRSGVRHAEIARRFDLAVGTISRIASERRLRRLKLHLLTDEELPEDDPPPEYLAANLRRCEGCGGTVYRWPCLACHLRAAQAAGIALPDEDDCIAATSGRDASISDDSIQPTSDEADDLLQFTATNGRGYARDATSGRDDAEGESGGEGERDQGRVSEGARSEVAYFSAEYQVLSTQYQVPSNAFSRSPPLPLSPSFIPTEPSHAHS